MIAKGTSKTRKNLQDAPVRYAESELHALLVQSGCEGVKECPDGESRCEININSSSSASSSSKHEEKEKKAAER